MAVAEIVRFQSSFSFFLSTSVTGVNQNARKQAVHVKRFNQSDKCTCRRVRHVTNSISTSLTDFICRDID